MVNPATDFEFEYKRSHAEGERGREREMELEEGGGQARRGGRERIVGGITLTLYTGQKSGPRRLNSIRPLSRR